ncbi:nuclear transport factor 2 family protein [Xanthomarina sp. GH4-25]|uniref:YybH family protein n=1 Tax=Xanthomarina sp. GH4-25 TaxID=3349335 RepID=UPI001402CC83
MRPKYILSFIIIFIVVLFSCNQTPDNKKETKNQVQQSEQKFINTIETHLNAVTNRDLETLKRTMSPKGNMQLILPGTEIINTVDGFMDYHKEWFSDDSWTFETKILNTEIGETMGMVITEIIYREPERNGGPYFNRMIVSYDLKKIEGEWYIIKDHASSIEKSTDKN